MKKGYYWIPPTDFTINAMEFYQAYTTGKTEVDYVKDVIYFSLDKYFPVGSVFHFIGDGGGNEYVITCRENKPGLHYIAERTDDVPVSHVDEFLFKRKRLVRRTGYAYDKG